MFTSFLEKITPASSQWSLLEKHRAQYFVLVTLVLFLYGALSSLLWFFEDDKKTWISSIFVPVSILTAILPLAFFHVKKSLQLSCAALLFLLFVVYNVQIVFSGYADSPMLLNLFYIPLIALLPGNARFAMTWAIASLLLVIIYFALSQFSVPQSDIALFESPLWYQGNIFCCLVLASVLALAYEKTVLDISDILTHERDEIASESVIDTLTGLGNKQMLEKYVESTIFRSSRLSQRFTMISVGVDNFASVNEDYGHHTGDEALIKLAQRLKKSVRSSDLVARYEGDTFIIVLPNIPGDTQPERFIEKLERLLQDPLITRKHELALTYDINHVIYPDIAANYESLLEALLFSGEKSPETVEKKEPVVGVTHG